MHVNDLNTLPENRAVAELLRCCGSTRWARQLAAARPFASLDAMIATADAVSASLDAEDWLEAFRAHPRIGESARSGGERLRPEGGASPRAPSESERGWGPASIKERWSGGPESWAAREQAGVRDTSATVRDRLAEGNRDYEARFGYIFIVCATGKSADEMLATLERRLANDPDTELRSAADEQRKITRLRIEKLLTS